MIKMLRQMHIRVPEDVQVIGYDGVRIFGDNDFICSTIVQPVKDIAEACVDMVLHDKNFPNPHLVCLPVTYAYGEPLWKTNFFRVFPNQRQKQEGVCPVCIVFMCDFS